MKPKNKLKILTGSLYIIFFYIFIIIVDGLLSNNRNIFLSFLDLYFLLCIPVLLYLSYETEKETKK